MSKKQDTLLKEYRKKVGGVIFTQVSVGARSRGKVPSEYRFIDGVRLVHTRTSTGKTKKFGGNQAEFKKQAKGRIVEAIEVDEDLNRWVIGQAIVGKVMLEIEYGVYAAIPVVVCKVRDIALEQACTVLGVKVWTPQDSYVVPVASSSKGKENGTWKL